MNRKILALFAVLAFATSAAADNATQAPAIVIKDVARFLDYQRDVRDDVESSKFKHMDESSKERLFAAQDEIFGLLKGRKSIDELSHEQQIELYNAQNLVAGILTDAELDRPVCKREKRVGSNMATTVCTTKRQMGLHKDDMQRALHAPRACNWNESRCG
jgi:hypothetical protein